jgi:hypothetical protein
MLTPLLLLLAAAAGGSPEEHDVALGAALRLHALKHRLAVVQHLQAPKGQPCCSVDQHNKHWHKL